MHLLKLHPVVLFVCGMVGQAIAQAAPIVESQSFLRGHSKPPRSLSAAQSAEVEKLLRRMTLKEKVGQMTQLEIGMVTDGKDQELTINPEKLKKAVIDYGVGSILNVKDEALPLERWHQLIQQIQKVAGQTRLKIPVIYGIDSIHGANYIKSATLFPQPLGMASTWNPELMLKGSEITAAETRAAGIPWNFSPVLDVGRQPLWPRLYETFGEDPYLATVMGVATVRGYEGDDIASPDRVAACLKHYVGYSFPTSGNDRTPALIPEITMRDYFLPAFAAAVKAGAHTIMVNSGEVNGTPGHVNSYLLKDVLRTELGFKGVAVSDWEDIKKLVNIHAIAADEKEATRRAVMAGIDMSMVPSDYSFPDLLVALVKERKVPMARIDEAVRRVLRLKMELGLFEKPLGGIGTGQKTNAGSGAAIAAARESVILLRNQKNILPLAKTTRILVTGPTADSLISLNNGWTYTWQGDRPAMYPPLPTIQAAVSKLNANVQFVPGTTIDKEVDIAAAVQAAANVDVIVACLGEASYAETPGNINDLTMPQPQLNLVRELAATGKPLVLVLAEGRPRIISSIADHAQAIVLALNPGNYGGQAIAEVLFGDVNPSGKLPITYPAAPNSLLNYDHKAYEGSDTSFGLKSFRSQFPFGSGLSYTTFRYSDLRVNAGKMMIGRPLNVSVRVTNSGQRAGKEVVQLYLTDKVASITPPGKRLKRFAKIALGPGESRDISFQLEPGDFAFTSNNGKKIVEPGEFVISIGDLTTTIMMTAGTTKPSR
jgi:beta-glucosidase